MKNHLLVKDFANEVRKDLSPSKFTEILGKTDYNALLWWTYESFKSNAVDNIDSALNAHSWPDRVWFGMRIRTRAKVTINSPGRGFRRSADWSTQFYPYNVTNGLIGFGNQIAAIEANDGIIKAIELHIGFPPGTRQMNGWRVS